MISWMLQIFSYGIICTTPRFGPDDPFLATSLIHKELDTVHRTNQFIVDLHTKHVTLSMLLFHCYIVTICDKLTRTHLLIGEHVCVVIICGVILTL